MQIFITTEKIKSLFSAYSFQDYHQAWEEKSQQLPACVLSTKDSVQNRKLELSENTH